MDSSLGAKCLGFGRCGKWVRDFFMTLARGWDSVTEAVAIPTTGTSKWAMSEGDEVMPSLERGMRLKRSGYENHSHLERRRSLDNDLFDPIIVIAKRGHRLPLINDEDLGSRLDPDLRE